MKAVNIHDAKTSLSRLVRDVREGREPEIVICLAGQPVAKIVPISAPPRRVLGADAGVIRIADDFEAPNPAIRTFFEGVSGCRSSSVM